jgi:hypothetical protein
MDHHFKKHYTLAEARALLPRVRKWLDQLAALRTELQSLEDEVGKLMAPGCDVGGSVVNRFMRKLLDLRELLIEFHERDIQIKDVQRGLVDFPAIIDGREVFLCWEKAEDDIGFWHDLETGFAGREPLPEAE